MTIAMTLADGSWIFLGGSGIAERPYGKVYGGAPGAIGPSSVSGRDSRERMADWSRGTK
jgi:hypothetical protein